MFHTVLPNLFLWRNDSTPHDGSIYDDINKTMSCSFLCMHVSHRFHLCKFIAQVKLYPQTARNKSLVLMSRVRSTFWLLTAGKAKVERKAFMMLHSSN